MVGEHDFVFPVTTLTGSDFYLEPFNITAHATAYYNATGTDSSLYSFMSIGPFPTQTSLIDNFITPWTSIPNNQLYAIMTTRQPKVNSSSKADSQSEDQAVKPSPPTPTLAGVVGFCSASQQHLKVEIGPIILVPQYQGIGLANSVVSLMITHALNPKTKNGGWGCRRIQWLSHTENGASIRLAEKMGFQREGLIRWDMVYWDGIARGKVGNGREVPPSATGLGDLARDSIIFGLYWDDR